MSRQIWQHSRSGRWGALALILVLLMVVGACQPVQVQPAAPAEQSAGAPAEAGAGTAGQSAEVSLWTEFTAGGEATGIDELVATWNASNPNITVVHRPIGNEEFFTVIRTGLAGGEPPDILQYEGYQQTRDFASAGQLLDLTDWWNEHKDRFALADAGEYACTYEGRIYCIPYTFQTGWQIYYNPDILQEHNIEVPQSFEDFLAAADTLKAAGVTPIAIGSKDGWPGEHWWMAFTVQRCGVDKVYEAIRRENDSKFTDDCFVQASADLQNLAEQGYFSAGAASDDYGTAQAVFLSGQAAFFQTGSWFASGWEQDPPPFEIGIMPFPRFEDAAFTGDVIGAITHVLAVPSGAADQDAALQVLDWFTTDEAARIWAKNGNIAMIQGAVDEAAPAVIQDMWEKVKAAETSLPWIENEMPPGVGEDKVYNGVVALISGSMTPEEFTQSVEDGMAAATAE